MLAWWHHFFGGLPDRDLLDSNGIPTDPLCVPAVRTGRVGALRLLDVHVTEHRRQLRGTFYSGSEHVPTLERFETANQILNALEAALDGNDDRVWRAVLNGRDAMTVDPRYVAIEQLQTLASFRLEALGCKRDPVSDFRRTSKDSAPRDALRRLQRVGPRFASVTDEEVFRALEGVRHAAPKRGRGNKSVFTALAGLMIDRAVPGASQLMSDDDRAGAVKRVAAAIQDAWTRAPNRTRRS